jgi:hypothetical protein
LELTSLMLACRPPLQQVPFTLDHDQAVWWLEDYATAHVGVGGLILKRVDEPYLGICGAGPSCATGTAPSSGRRSPRRHPPTNTATGATSSATYDAART